MANGCFVFCSTRTTKRVCSFISPYHSCSTSESNEKCISGKVAFTLCSVFAHVFVLWSTCQFYWSFSFIKLLFRSRCKIHPPKNNQFSRNYSIWLWLWSMVRRMHYTISENVTDIFLKNLFLFCSKSEQASAVQQWNNRCNFRIKFWPFGL